MKMTAAFREARALSLTRGARFCVYGYRTVSGTWDYSFHARRPLCEQRDAPPHPARADRQCPVCGNYPSACTCRVGDGSPRATAWPARGVEDIRMAFALELGIEEDNE